MRQKLLVAALTVLISMPAMGGGVADHVFDSSFETGEGCVSFDGFGDAINIRVVSISGDFTLDGQDFPQSEYDDANFYLRDRVTGDLILLGNSHDLDYIISVVPGRYDVIYDSETSGATAPRNKGAVLMENLALYNDRSLDIDVQSHDISGEYLLNGGAFPNSEYDDADFWLDSETNGRVHLGNSHDHVFEDIMVIPGNYDVRYANETAGAETPLNKWALIQRVKVNQPIDDLTIDVQSVELTGSLTHNGAAFPTLEYDDGDFYLASNDGDNVYLESSHIPGGVYSTNVVKGKYFVFWVLETLGDTMPINRWVKVTEFVDITPGTLDIDLKSYLVTGDFSLNGGAFPASQFQTGTIFMRQQGFGLATNLADTHDQSYSKRIAHGTYDFYYQYYLGSDVPQNKSALVMSGAYIGKARTIDFDLSSRTLFASAWHNGALFTASQQNQGELSIVDPETGDSVVLGRTYLQNLSKQVLIGTYDVIYRHVSGEDVPLNSRARIMEGLVVAPIGPVLQGGGGTKLEVNSRLIGGPFYRNGMPPPGSEYDDGIVSLIRDDDLVPLGNTHDMSYTARVIDYPDPINYLIHYASETKGDLMPHNRDARLKCVKLVPPNL